MGRKNLIILIIALPLLLTYNNCSRSSGNLAGGSTFSSIGASGSPFNGSLNLEHFSSAPNCSLEWTAPTEQLSLNGDTQSAQLQWHRCNDEGQAGVVFDQVKGHSYNPYLAYYNDQVYASSELHQGMTDHVYYAEYCYNQSLQMDFTIQYLLIDLPGSSTPLKDWVGVIIQGPQAEFPGLYFNGGFMETDTDGNKHFDTDNNAYEIEILAADGAARKRAIMTRANGRSITFDCWFDSTP